MKPGKTTLRTLVLTLTMFCFLGVSCTRSLRGMYKDGHVKRTTDPPVPLSFYKEDKCILGTSSSMDASIHYLGCGGFLIESVSGSVLIDPYFSHKSFWLVPFSRLRVKTRVIDGVLNDHEQTIRQTTEALLVTHS